MNMIVLRCGYDLVRSVIGVFATTFCVVGCQ
jgi:hypothetical protein